MAELGNQLLGRIRTASPVRVEFTGAAGVVRASKLSTIARGAFEAVALSSGRDASSSGPTRTFLLEQRPSPGERPHGRGDRSFLAGALMTADGHLLVTD